MRSGPTFFHCIDLKGEEALNASCALKAAIRSVPTPSFVWANEKGRRKIKKNKSKLIGK
jgi:hypothetical protein